MNPGVKRVLVVDDHPAAREGLAMRIAREPDLEVCGEADDVPSALRIFDESRPHVVVVDVGLRGESGLELVERLQAREDAVPVLVWSMHPDSLYAERSVRAGARGYVNKGQATTRIVEAIRTVLSGRLYLSPETADRLLHVAVGGRKNQPESPLEALSNRELEVFQLIGSGLTTSEIAARLKISVHTVETHRQRIKGKLQIDSSAVLRRDATRWMLEQETE